MVSVIQSDDLQALILAIETQNRNPKVVNKARVGAETLAEVVNSFFEVISWRTMVNQLSLVSGP
jgi:hypothetical protein